jgi:WD40 repeat protein
MKKILIIKIEIILLIIYFHFPINAELRQQYWHLGGHYDQGYSDGGNINSFNKFPEDDKFLTSGSDGTVRIYDLNTYSLLRIFDIDTTEYPRSVRASVTPDGKYFLTADLKVYEVESGLIVRTLNSNSKYGYLFKPVFSNDGKYAASLGSILPNPYEKIIIIYNFQSGEYLTTIINNTRITDFQFYDNDKLCLIDIEGDITYWDLISDKIIKKFNLGYQDDFPTHIAMSSDGKYIMHGTLSVILIWDVEKNKNIYIYDDGFYNIKSSFSKFDDNFAYCSNFSIIIRSIKNGEIIKEIKCPFIPSGVEYSEDGNKIYISGEITSNCEVFDLITNKSRSIVNFSGKLVNLKFSNDGKFLFTLDRIFGNYLSLKKFDILNKTLIWMHNVDEPKFETEMPLFNYPLAISNNDKYICLIKNSKEYNSNGHDVLILNTEDGTIKYLLIAHSKDITSLSFSMDNKFLVSTSLDKTIKIWNLETSQLEKNINAKIEVSIAVLKNENILNCVLSYDRTSKIMATYNIEKDFWQVSNYSFSLADGFYKNPLTISNDYNFIATENVGFDNNIDFIDCNTQNSIFRFGYELPYSLAISYDNKYVASSYEDSIVKIWDIDKGDSIYVFSYSQFKKWHAYYGFYNRGRIIPAIKALAFSPDYKYIAAGNDDASVVIWENKFVDVEEKTITKDNKVVIFPNPSSDFLNLYFDNLLTTDISEIKIYSGLGNKIEITKPIVNGNNIQIDVSSFPQGVYYISFFNAGKVERARFLKIDD